MLELTVTKHLMFDVSKDGFQGHQPGTTYRQSTDNQARQAFRFGPPIVGANPGLGALRGMPGGSIPEEHDETLAVCLPVSHQRLQKRYRHLTIGLSCCPAQERFLRAIIEGGIQGHAVYRFAPALGDPRQVVSSRPGPVTIRPAHKPGLVQPDRCSVWCGPRPSQQAVSLGFADRIARVGAGQPFLGPPPLDPTALQQAPHPFRAEGRQALHPLHKGLCQLLQGPAGTPRFHGWPLPDQRAGHFSHCLRMRRGTSAAPRTGPGGNGCYPSFVERLDGAPHGFDMQPQRLGNRAALPARCRQAQDTPSPVAHDIIGSLPMIQNARFVRGEGSHFDGHKAHTIAIPPQKSRSVL